MQSLAERKEIILRQELAFANEIGALVFQKPAVSYWMILIPFLFLYFVYRMHVYKTSRVKFDEDFMVTRREAMAIAWNAAEAGIRPVIGSDACSPSLPEELKKPYLAWVGVLVDHYTELLSVRGNRFEELVRAAYRNRTEYLLALNRLNTVERDYYAALRPRMAAAEGASEVIATIESHSQRLRRELAERIFP